MRETANRKISCFCERTKSVCWRWTIFPARLQASIVASAELNFCVRNGNRWTLCGKNTNCASSFPRGYALRLKPLGLCQHWTIFPARLQASIVASAELNFCVRNGNRWTLCDKNTDCWANSTYGAPSGTRTLDPLIKSQLLYQLS